MINNKLWRGLYIIYAITFVVNVIMGIKNNNLAYITVCIWILNSIILFACARHNEKRADKFEKLYFDEIEKNIKEKVDKYMRSKK